MKPLNGEKTHPLTPHALSVLRRLERGALFGYEINPGVRNRLAREDLAGPGQDTLWRITDAGRAKLRETGR